MAPARGVTPIKFSARRSKRDVEIGQQCYIVVLAKVTNKKRERTSNMVPLSTQRPFRMTVQISYSLLKHTLFLRPEHSPAESLPERTRRAVPFSSTSVCLWSTCLFYCGKKTSNNIGEHTRLWIIFYNVSRSSFGCFSEDPKPLTREHGHVANRC